MNSLNNDLNIVRMWLDQRYDGWIGKLNRQIEKKARKRLQELKTKGTLKWRVPYKTK